MGGWLRKSLIENNINTLREAVNRMLSSSESSIVALGILCIATCIQQLDHQSHKEIIRQLRRPPGDVFQGFFDRVCRIIIKKTGILATLALLLELRSLC